MPPAVQEEEERSRRGRLCKINIHQNGLDVQKLPGPYVFSAQTKPLLFDGYILIFLYQT
jgi:hypothetical protein